MSLQVFHMVVFFDYSESMSKVLDTVEPIKEVSTNDEKVQIINVLIEEYLNASIFPLENFNFSREQKFLYRISTEIHNIQYMYPGDILSVY